MEHLFKSTSPEITMIVVDPNSSKMRGHCGPASGSGKGDDSHKRVDRRSSSVNKSEWNVSPESNNDSQKSYQFCRICHEGDSINSEISPSSNGSSSGGSTREQLIAPCRCTGSVAMVHLSCLEHWLTTSNSDKCELCHFVYKTRKMPRTWAEFLTESDNQFNIRNMIADIICFFLLTPLLVVSTYLCGLGAFQYYLMERWEAVGLITLSFFLLAVYFTWCHVTLKYHFGVWRAWERTHQRVRITFGDGSIGEYRRIIPEASAEIIERRRNRNLVISLEEGHFGAHREDRRSSPGGNREVIGNDFEDERFNSRDNLYLVNHNYNHRFPIQVLRHQSLASFVVTATHPEIVQNGVVDYAEILDDSFGRRN